MKFTRQLVITTFISLAASTFGQVSLPHMEHIYGGTIRQIDMVSNHTNETFLYVCAEGPRALFYGEMNTDTGDIATMFGGWNVVPDFEGNLDHGVPAQFMVHQTSERIFVADEDEGLLSCTLSSGSLITNIPGSFKAIRFRDDSLFAIEVTNQMDQALWYGTADSSGTLSLCATPLPIDTESYVTIAFNPSNNFVYLMESMNATSIYKSSHTYDQFTNTTTFTEIPLPSPLDTWDGEMRIGFGHDGKLFVGGQTNLIVQFGVSTNDGVSFEVTDTERESAGTTMGLGFEVVGTSTDYEIYYGIFANTNSGATNAWIDLPRSPGGWAETHVNMGAIRVDPNNSDILYMTTDQGTGLSTNAGTHVWENNQGLTATHVSDLDLAATTKDIAWLSSKNGAWRTTNFTTTASWNDAHFPDGIVNSIAIDQTDSSYDTAYAGSRRVWKTTDAGSNWNQLYSALAQDGTPISINDGWVEAIEVSSNLVFAGYHGYEHDAPGGILSWSTNSGTDWSVIITNVNVTDLLFTPESSTDTLFAAFAYYTNTTPHGIYRFDPNTAALTQIFTNAVQITDLENNPTGTVFAAGIDPKQMPVVYLADTSLTTWQQLPTNGLPQITPTEGPSDWIGPSLAIGTNAFGHQIIYMALEHSIWFLPHTNTTWQTTPYMQLSSGSRIHVIVWDDLLIGTDSGLYSQDMDTDGDGLSDVEETGTYNTDPTLADTDNDGIQDLEEINKTNTDPTDPDSDNDGLNDGNELIAGTSPTNALSLFEITKIDLDTSPEGSTILQWSSVNGKKYSIWETTNLLNGFVEVASNLTATPPANVYTNTPPDASSIFYRITTE